MRRNLKSHYMLDDSVNDSRTHMIRTSKIVAARVVLFHGMHIVCGRERNAGGIELEGGKE